MLRLRRTATGAVAEVAQLPSVAGSPDVLHAVPRHHVDGLCMALLLIRSASSVSWTFIDVEEGSFDSLS